MAQRSKSKFDSVNDPKRPLYLQCQGGPMKALRVDERTPAKVIPIPEETGGPAIAGHYFLKGSIYVYEPNR